MTTELKTWLDENIDDEISNEFFQDSFPTEDSDLEWASDEIVELYQQFQNEKITIVAEDSYGGEGQGEEYWSVYSFTKGDEKVYIKFNGWYQSYNGSEFTEWFYVEPQQVTVTKFVKV